MKRQPTGISQQDMLQDAGMPAKAFRLLVEGEAKQRLVKLGKSARVWIMQTTQVPDPYSSDLICAVWSLSLRLPPRTLCVKSVIVDGVCVYDSRSRGYARSAALITGGRFYHRSTLIDRDVVHQGLVLRDIPVYRERGDEYAAPVVSVVVVEEKE